MQRFVLNVFKVIIISTIMLIVMDTSIYVLRALSVHYKVQSLSYSLCMDVSKNNWLTDEAENLYCGASGLLEDIRSNDPEFIKSIAINRTALKDVKPYGDVHTIRIRVGIDTYRFSMDASNGGDVTHRDIADLEVEGKDDAQGIFVFYEYRVPCLRYIK